MAKKENKKKNGLSIDEEFLVCAAIRYCVGRKSIASVCEADYIAREYYNRLSQGRLEFLAKDIRVCIEDQLRFMPFTFTYSGSVSYEKRLPLEDFISFMDTLKDPEKELQDMSNIEVYCESYRDDAPKLYRTSTANYRRGHMLSQYDIDTLLPWQRLAALFDKKHYKKLVVNYNGEESERLAVVSYVCDTAECDDEKGVFRMLPWRYKKVYMFVDDIASGRVNHPMYVLDEYIVSVEDVDASEKEC